MKQHTYFQRDAGWTFFIMSIGKDTQSIEYENQGLALLANSMSLDFEKGLAVHSAGSSSGLYQK